MSGRVRSRRRAGLGHQGSQETKTVYGDQAISRVSGGSESKSTRRLPKLAQWWQTASNWLLNLFLPPAGPGSVQIFISDAYRVQVVSTEIPSVVTTQGFIWGSTLWGQSQWGTSEVQLRVVLGDAYRVRAVATDIYGGAVAFYVGKAIRLSNWGGTTASPTGGYRNVSGTLYDPSTPSLKYRLPGQTTTQTVSGGSLTHDGTGLYSFVVTPTEDGDALATFTSNDGAYADPITFKVEPAPL